MTDADHTQAPGKGQLEREAAEWCVRMHGEDREHWRGPFEDWLKLGALHLAAYNRIEEVYLMGAMLRPNQPAAKEVAEAPPPRQPFAGAIALAVAIGLVVLAWVVLPAPSTELARQESLASSERSQRLRVTTGEGQPRLLTLRDGSAVSLAGSSSVRVAFDGQVRRVELLRGSGMFTVAPSRRPFIVWAGGGTVTALGTRFEVRMDPARRVHVRLIEGQIEIRTPEAGQGRQGPTRLEAGQSRTYLAAPVPNESVAENGEPAQPLTVGELVDLANARPGATRQISIADPQLRAMRLGGRFQVRDPAVVAEQLAIMFDLKIDRADEAILALAPRE